MIHILVSFMRIAFNHISHCVKMERVRVMCSTLRFRGSNYWYNIIKDIRFYEI